MKNIFPYLRRGFGLRFWLAALASMALVFLGYLQPLLQIRQQGSYLYQDYHNILFSDALSSEALVSFLPVLATIPVAGVYLEDIKSKFSRFLLVRESYGGYLLGQMYACWLCGGLAALLGTATAYGLTVLLLTPVERVLESFPPTETHIGSQLILLFLNGGLWAVMGMAMSTLMESKYIAYVSPFIIYYLLVILYERYFSKWFLIYPREWMNPSDLWPLGFWGPAILMIELTFLCSLLFVFRAGRRLREL